MHWTSALTYSLTAKSCSLIESSLPFWSSILCEFYLLPDCLTTTSSYARNSCVSNWWVLFSTYLQAPPCSLWPISISRASLRYQQNQQWSAILPIQRKNLSGLKELLKQRLISHRTEEHLNQATLRTRSFWIWRNIIRDRQIHVNLILWSSFQLSKNY